MVLTLILGDQLHREWFAPSPLQLAAGSRVLMIEDLAVASTYRYHQLRLLHTFVAMRSFRDALVERGLAVRYFELPASAGVSFWERLAAELGEGRELQVAEIADRSFEQRLHRFCREHLVRLTVLPSPAFLESVAESRAWFEGRRRPFMKTFYERQRRRLGLLLEADGTPSGGRWSFDAENRRRLPKGYQEPPLPAVAASPHEPAVRQLIATHFATHPGVLGELWIPFDHDGADAWLQRFLQDRLEGFGPYEDALSARLGTLHHSLLSPLLNIGLLSPAGVIEATLAHVQRRQNGEQPVPIASLEGFLRQVIGWREFVRGIDRVHGETPGQQQLLEPPAPAGALLDRRQHRPATAGCGDRAAEPHGLQPPHRAADGDQQPDAALRDPPSGSAPLVHGALPGFLRVGDGSERLRHGPDERRRHLCHQALHLRLQLHPQDGRFQAGPLV